MRRNGLVSGKGRGVGCSNLLLSWVKALELEVKRKTCLKRDRGYSRDFPIFLAI